MSYGNKSFSKSYINTVKYLRCKYVQDNLISEEISIPFWAENGFAYMHAALPKTHTFLDRFHRIKNIRFFNFVLEEINVFTESAFEADVEADFTLFIRLGEEGGGGGSSANTPFR